MSKNAYGVAIAPLSPMRNANMRKISVLKQGT